MTSFKTKKSLDWAVDESMAGMRLDKALMSLADIGSRTRAAQLIDAGLVRQIANSRGATLEPKRSVKASQQIVAGEIFRIELPEKPTPEHLVPLEMALDIVHEDDDVIVLNKPAGLVVHPAAGHEQDTLVNALLAHTKDLSVGFATGRPGIVHRLDRDTSGLLVVAKNDQAHQFLAQQFQTKSVHRVYWALAFGVPAEPNGRMESFLKRHPKDRKRFASSADQTGKRAVTHYKLIQSYQKVISLIHCQLETGRTHQIRVHLSENLNPILGDKLYGSGRRNKALGSVKLREHIDSLNRIGLHAAELGFIHPRTRSEMKFSSAWPKDLIEIVEILGFGKSVERD
jgi:23S rRNA pseudouridine1911/1915/1917 synthase